MIDVSRASVRSALSALALLFFGAACTHDEQGENFDGGLPDVAATVDGSTLPDLRIGNQYGPDLGYLCSNSTGSIVIPGSTRCTADLAKATFLFAMCSCTDIDTDTSGLTVGATSSTSMMSIPAGSVGMNGRFIGGSGTIDGPVWAAGAGGTQPVVTATNMTLKRDVKCGGDLSVNGILQIEGDAFVSGAVNGSNGILAINGTLYQPASSPAPQSATIGGGTSIGPVSIAAPCSCDNPLQIAPIIAAFQSKNDDAILGLDPTSFIDFGSKNLNLGCGAYYFDAIKNGNLNLHVVGPTAIFVAGDVDAQVSITVEPGGQLDLFIGGNVHLSGAWNLGSVNAPANTRIYVGGSTMTLEGAFSINGNLYAPNVDLSFNQTAFDIHGSVFAYKITMRGIAGSVVYDEAIGDVGGCQPPGGGCSSCHDCAAATPACKGGSCVACTTNSDCCPPLSCQPDGTCALDVL
jgi:hypothetical protein